MERLIGEGIKAEDLNDDVLGSALDKIFDYGPDTLYPQLAESVVSQLGLLTKFVHLDATGFHVDGRYNHDTEPEDGVIRITKGYSRDHRPDLNQVVLQLICERQAGIPLMMETLSGNNSDKTSFYDTVNAHIDQMRTDFGIEYIVADSALYVADTLALMKNVWWISRVPETITLARDIIHDLAPDLMSNLSESAHRSLGVLYAGINQRWLVVYSPEAYHRALITVNKQTVKQSTAEYNKFNKLCNQEFSCEADARAAFSVFKKTQKVTFVNEIQVVAQPKFNDKGRPSKDKQPDFYTYRLEGSIASLCSERTRRLERKSCFILATNQLDCKELSDLNLIVVYKDQQKVEGGFRFLKDPLFMASTIFLKSPKRIMALMMVMTLCLLVYAALEYRIREILKKQAATFPDQKGKETVCPTARLVFQYFSGIHVLTISQMQDIVLRDEETINHPI